MLNQVRFDETEHEFDPIVRESVLTQHAILAVPMAHAYQVELTQVERQDNILMAIPGISKHSNQIFSIEKTEPQFFVKSRGQRLEFSFQVSLDERVITRRVLNLTQVLGEVGGLFAILIFFAQQIDAVATHRRAQTYLVSQLYKIPKREVPQPGKRCCSPRQCLARFFCCKCSRQNRRAIAFRKGKVRMDEELDVVQLLRALRFYDAIARRLFTERQVEDTRKQTKRLSLLIDEVEAVSKKVADSSQASDSVSQREGEISDRLSSQLEIESFYLPGDEKLRPPIIGSDM